MASSLQDMSKDAGKPRAKSVCLPFLRPLSVDLTPLLVRSDTKPLLWNVYLRAVSKGRPYVDLGRRK